MIIIAVLALAIAFCVAGYVLYERYDFEIISTISWVVGIIAAIAVVIMGIAAMCVNAGLDGQIASHQARYESIVYQAQASLYDNDNDIGKKELANQIQEWNEDVAKGKVMEHDFWLGVFYPDIYDNIDIIPIELLT